MDTEAKIERYLLDEILMADARTNIDPDQSLISSGVLDSVALLRLILFLEEQFGINVGRDEVVPDNFETINNMKAFIQRKLS